MKKPTGKKIKASELDKKFDAGENIDQYVDWSSATKNVLVEFPVQMIKALDEEAAKSALPERL
jgi:hypothetical protein